MHGIDEQIDCREAAGQEGTPPPVIVLETYKGRHVRIHICQLTSGVDNI